MIIGKNVTLRSLEIDDVNDLLVYWNDIEFMNYSGRTSLFSQQEGRDWIRSTWEERKEEIAYTFAIEVHENRMYIGNIRLKILNWISRRADISIGIFNPNYRNKGLGSESLALLVDFGFYKLNLLSMELKVFSNNKRAITCYEKLGFQKIGYRRKADYIQGEYLDDLMMDLLIEEWRLR